MMKHHYFIWKFEITDINWQNIQQTDSSVYNVLGIILGTIDLLVMRSVNALKVKSYDYH